MYLTRFLWAGLLTAGLTFAATDPSTVLVLVNDLTPAESGTNGTGASVWVGQYYAAQRGIPAQNVLHLSVQGNSCGSPPNGCIDNNPASFDSYNIPWSRYDGSIRQPVKAYLEANGLKTKIKYIVPVYGIPFQLLDLAQPETANVDAWPTNSFSLDAFLASMYSGQDNLLISNPYAVSDPGYFKAHFQDWVNPQGWPMYLVTRLDGPSALIAAGLVDKAKQGEASLQINTTEGTGYFDWKGTANFPDTSMQNADTLAGKRGFAHVLNNQSVTNQYIQSAPDTLWAWGWYRINTCSTCYGFVSGAVGAQLTSYTANNIRAITASGWVPLWLSQGITATWGATTEPYTTGYALGDNLLQHFWYGFNFAEASYQAAPSLNWNMVFVGDPLYAPPAFNTSFRGRATPKPPILSAPSGGGFVYSNETFTMTMNLPALPAVAGVTYLAEGQPLTGELTTAPYQAAVSTGNNACPNGPRLLTARVRYTSGLVMISDPITAILSNTGTCP